MTVLSIIFSAEQETHHRIRNAKQTATQKGGETMAKEKEILRKQLELLRRGL